MKIKISLIVEAMNRANSNETYYLSEKLGRVWVATENGNYYLDNSKNSNEKFVIDKYSIELPGQYEINEYQIIKDFINSLEDGTIKEQLFIVIQGPGAFRRFKDSCINFEIIDKWYKFREENYYELAKEWCLWNSVTYIDDIKESKNN